MSAKKNGDDEAERRTFDAAVANAQAAVAGLSDKYIGWVNDDLKRLDAAIARVADGHDAVALQAVYDVSHDIKGQGSTFGYALVTEIAHRLCRYTDEATRLHKVDRTVIDAHVTALRTVVDNRIQGNAGDLGAEILRALEEAAAKSLG